MSLYEMEVALLDGFILSYVDEDYTQCDIKYVGGNTVKQTLYETFENTYRYCEMSNLLMELENNNINIDILN